MSDPRREAVYQAILHPLLGLSGDGEWAAEAAHQAADAVLAALDATEPAEWEQVGMGVAPMVAPEPGRDWTAWQFYDGLEGAHVDEDGYAWEPVFVRRPVPSATPAAEPTACPTCGSDDPDRCTFDGFDHEHGHVAGCCPDPWHGGGTADRTGEGS